LKQHNKNMTELECLEALLKRERAERVVYLEPNSKAVAAVHAGASIHDAYANPDFSYQTQKRIAEDIGWIFQPSYSSIGTDFGGESKPLEMGYGQAPAIVRYPVKDENDVWQLKLPDLKSLSSVRKGLAFCDISAREKLNNEYFNVVFSCSGPFTAAGEMCGLERLTRWLVRKPEVVHHLLRLVMDHTLHAARLWLDTYKGANLLFYHGEPTSSNQIISPEHFKQFALPYIKELHEKLLGMGYKHIMCHICGDHNANLQYWAQVPMGDPGIVSFGDEVDLQTAARFFPSDIIYGNINPAVIQTGTPKQVYLEAKKIILKGKKIPNGYIFGRGCELPPRASRDNLKAMIAAVNDFGWYD
jgi:uroporphyrinogen decarboxylase